MNDSAVFRIRLAAGRTTLLFLALVLPLTFSIQLEDGFELTQMLCALVATAFFLLMLKWSDWVEAVQANKIFYFLALIFLGCGVYSFLGLVRGVSFYFSTQNYLWILSIILLLLPVGLFLDKRKFYSFLVFSGVLGSLYSFAQALGLDLGGWSTHFGGRSFSTLGNPIFWAGHLLVLLPLAIYLALSSKDKEKRFIWFAAIGVFALSLLTTQTRGAWLGVLGEAATLVVLNWKKNQVWKWVMMGVIAFLLAILVVPSLKDRAISMFHIHNQDAQGRYFLWNVAIKQWEEKKWFGQGPGGYANHFNRFQALLSQEEPFRPYWMAFHAHEEYLEFLADRGVVGVGLGAAILWLMLMRRIRANGIFGTGVASSLSPAYSASIPRNDSYQGISASVAEIAIIVGIGIHSLFNFPLSVVPTACALALLFNPSWDRVSSLPLKEMRMGGEIRIALGLGLLVVCGLGMRVVVQNARLHQAIDLINGQRYEEALKLLDFDPSSNFFHYLDPRVWKQKAIALEALGSVPEAVSLWEKVVQAYPYDADADAMLCMLYGKQKQWNDSEHCGMQALQISPFHEQALNNLAMAAYLQGRKKDAIQYLSRLEQAESAWGQDGKAAEIQQKISALTHAPR